MAYTLNQLIEDCRAAIADDLGRKGRAAVCSYVAEALNDLEFIAEHLPEDSDEERRVLYEDPDYGFCICAHVYKGAKNGKPHDHGSTWAIYGQASGETSMTDWDIVVPATADTAAKVKMGRTYKLSPGDVHLYEVGDVHAPFRDAPTRLLRIEGKDTKKLKRTAIEVVE